jgi:hypothetical protein
MQLARNHDQYVKNETVDLLNDRGLPRTFVIGALAKARFPLRKQNWTLPVPAPSMFPLPICVAPAVFLIAYLARLTALPSSIIFASMRGRFQTCSHGAPLSPRKPVTFSMMSEQAPRLKSENFWPFEMNLTVGFISPKSLIMVLRQLLFSSIA